MNACAQPTDARDISRREMRLTILVTRKRSHWTGGDRYCDIRVDLHPEAVQELGRILERHSFKHLIEGRTAHLLFHLLDDQ